eukprot:13849503-Ditylum_brightwellii.AAC.1
MSQLLEGSDTSEQNCEKLLIPSFSNHTNAGFKPIYFGLMRLGKTCLTSANYPPGGELIPFA